MANPDDDNSRHPDQLDDDRPDDSRVLECQRCAHKFPPSDSSFRVRKTGVGRVRACPICNSPDVQESRFDG